MGAQDTTEVQSPLPDYYTTFIKESPKAPGDHGIPAEKVQKQISEDLNDPELIAQGQEFVRRNYFAVVLSHFIFMMWVFGSKFGRIVILHSGGSIDKESSLRRYLATIVRMCNWYEGDFSKPLEGAQGDIVRVRKIHSIAAKTHPMKPRPELPQLTERQRKILEALRAETANVDTSKTPDYVFQDEDPEIPLSQFHMSMGQWGFMGLIVAYPELFGVYDTKGIDGYVHMWAVIARELGIEDRFNWALIVKRNKGNTEELKKVYRHIAQPLLKGSDEWTVLLLESMIKGVGEYVRVVKFVPMLKHMLATVGLEGKSLDPLMSWRARLSCWISMTALREAGRFRFTNWLRNTYLRWCLNRAEKMYLKERKW